MQNGGKSSLITLPPDSAHFPLKVHKFASSDGTRDRLHLIYVLCFDLPN